MTALESPATSKESAGKGVRAVIVAPTRELAHQIHNECLKLAESRKWRIILFSKATASTLSDKAVRDKVGKLSAYKRHKNPAHAWFLPDIIISTPLRLVASLQTGDLELSK